MGKQVNYYMNYESFLQVAQTALDAGCLIIRRDHTDEKQLPMADISAVIPECNFYYFYLPELGELEYKTDIYGKYYLNASGKLELAIIEAGFSKHPADQARIFITTGYYDEYEKWIPRSERLTKVYEKLARKAKKVAQKIL